MAVGEADVTRRHTDGCAATLVSGQVGHSPAAGPATSRLRPIEDDTQIPGVVGFSGGTG